jgi:hypothetical protein
MTSETQVLYRGKHADSRPTEPQIALLQKMGVRQPIIDSLNREQAFLLIRRLVTEYYEARFEKQRKPQMGVLKW